MERLAATVEFAVEAGVEPAGLAVVVAAAAQAGLAGVATETVAGILAALEVVDNNRLAVDCTVPERLGKEPVVARNQGQPTPAGYTVAATYCE